MKFLTSLLVFASLMGCATIDPDYGNPERCARVYAPQALRIYESALNGVAQESARVVERVDIHPAPDELIIIVEWTVKEAYRAIALEQSKEQFKAEYISNCEYLLNKPKIKYTRFK